MTPPEETDELQELDALPRELAPPPELERRVLGVLRRRGLVRDPAAARGRPWLLAAACIFAVALGWVVRGLMPAPAASTETGALFLLLLSEPTPLRTTKPLADLVAEYRSWAGRLDADGRLATAARLEPIGQVLQADSAGDVRRLPETDPSAATGFFVVRAANLEEALGLAESCPHVAYGGRVHVRPVAR